MICNIFTTLYRFQKLIRFLLQSRFQLYIWLEREVEVLQYLCNYGDSSLAADDNQPSQTINYYEGKLSKLSLMIRD